MFKGQTAALLLVCFAIPCAAWSVPAGFARTTLRRSTVSLSPPMAAARAARSGGVMRASMAMDVSTSSQLAQLSGMTVLSVDTGDLTVIEELGKTGYITDATTNPLFVSQAGTSGDPRYVAFVDEAIKYANEEGKTLDDNAKVGLAIDRLAVNLGTAISKLVPGYVSTEVDPRLSFSMEESLTRARGIIAMYEKEGVPRSRILIKLAATWEGIKAAEILEKEGITCNLTLVFGVLQAAAAAQAGARLISPFTGRILDWHKVDKKQEVYPIP
ncbi:hypothetical protein T484DRAFT_2731410 [Baffinella frigidus]|nr:hypothetical protein T484DRAFT_2731410 [Cryptophyta sp. CCMP2293]